MHVGLSRQNKVGENVQHTGWCWYWLLVLAAAAAARTMLGTVSEWTAQRAASIAAAEEPLVEAASNDEQPGCLSINPSSKQRPAREWFRAWT